MDRFQDWIYEDNLVAWMEIMSSLVGYEWDDFDEAELAVGLDETDVEADHWFEHQLGSKAVVGLARDVGTAVLHIRVDGPVHPGTETAVSIAQSYRLGRRT